MGQSDNQVQGLNKRVYDEIKPNPNGKSEEISPPTPPPSKRQATIAADGSPSPSSSNFSYQISSTGLAVETAIVPSEETHIGLGGPVHRPHFPIRVLKPHTSDDKEKLAVAEPAKRMRWFDDNSTAEKVIMFLKEHLQPNLLTRLKQLLGHEKMADFGEEMADLGNLLMLMSPPNSQWEKIAQQIRNGAIKLNEGKRLVTEGHNLLRDAGSDMPTSIE